MVIVAAIGPAAAAAGTAERTPATRVDRPDPAVGRAAARRSPAMSDTRITTLDNGLVVVTEHVPAALSLAAGAFVGVGARDEPEELCGISHFLEHLLFKGTLRHSAQEVSRAIDRVGGEMDAYTTKEHTAFYCRLPAPAAALGVGLLGEVVVTPALRAEDVTTERRVILEELAMDDDEPEDVAYRLLAGALYPDHPLGRETAGERVTVSRIGAPDVRAFHEEHYRAGSSVVSIAGPLTHDEQLALVAQAFGALRPGDGRPRREAPAGPATRRVHEDDDTEQVQLVVGSRALRRDDPDREALDVIVQVLGGGMSSRLFDAIRERRGLAYSVYAASTAYDDAGALTVYAGTLPEHLAEVAGLIRATLDDVAGQGITAEELEIATGYLTGTFVLGLEDTGSRMARNASQLISTGTIRSMDDQLARWRAVTLDDVARVAAAVLGSPRVTVTVGPHPGSA